jgi:ribosomal protein S18 acetylase RimI-like enzyme
MSKLIDRHVVVTLLSAEDAISYRELRLLALQSHPEAFGSSFEEESALSESAFAERLTSGAVFGAWSGAQLMGCAGLVGREKTKLRHKAALWGMFVRPEARGCGLGKRLLDEVIAYARPRFQEVLLTVVEGNAAAHRLYISAGFEEYGREPCTIKIAAVYYHELLMRLPFQDAKATSVAAEDRH